MGVAAPRPVSKWTVTVSIAFGAIMATIDSSIVNVAVPVIRGEMSATLQEITWISTAYMVAMVLVMPLTGFLGAFFGQKRVYLASLALFVAASALCGTAGSLEALLVYRILQGLGGGALQPTQQAILRQTFPPEEQGMAMAIFSMVIMVGPAIGPVLGGWIIDNHSWRWIFYINLPVGLLGIFMTWRNVVEPEDVRIANRGRAEVMRKNLDWAGIILMVIGVAALQLFLEEGPQEDWFASPYIVFAAFVAAIAIAAFVIRELTATAPVVNLRLFADPTFASGTAVATVMFGVLMGSMFLLPVFMQELLQFPATQSGLVLMPRTLAMMVAAPIVGRLYNRVPPAATVAFGVFLYLIGSFQLSHITLDTSSTDLIVPLAITGVAFACLFVPLTTAALSSMPRHQLAEAAGLNSFLRQIGGSVGLTISTTVFTRYASEASSALAAQVSVLRPEVAERLAATKAGLMAHGFDAVQAGAIAIRSVQGKVAVQGLVIGFEKAFLVQGIAFLFVLPLLLFLKVQRTAAPAHIETSLE
ncbi:MAG: DHA2 family efflux MFS transporter permease subunit [Kofleriaceae bacterium]|nr:DHA2 family efflux MFS transporter permease subunit [Myxococcales bacterium]MCB9561861.1 DHA2 family efflux MFS transporter permease subunit [Kofleriaceae bacterium]MCB9573410.1 DHA2 family efflux MFS transporter permease subunit [Kofleriaceae bacterium]